MMQDDDHTRREGTEEATPGSITLLRDMVMGILSLNKKQRFRVYEAVARFAAYGEEPDFTPEKDGAVYCVWASYKDQLRASRNKSIARSKGGKASKRNNPNGRKGKQRSDGMMQTPPPEAAARAPDEGQAAERFDAGREFASYDEMHRSLLAFAETIGATPKDVEKYFDYSMMNFLPADEEGGDQLRAAFEADKAAGRWCIYDKHGNRIENVYGAFRNFMRSGYSRPQWLADHGITPKY